MALKWVAGWLPNTFSLIESSRTGFFARTGAGTFLFPQGFLGGDTTQVTVLLASQATYASLGLVMSRLRHLPANPSHCFWTFASWGVVFPSQLALVPWKLTSPELLGALNRQGEKSRSCQRVASCDALTRCPNGRPSPCQSSFGWLRSKRVKARVCWRNRRRVLPNWRRCVASV